MMVGISVCQMRENKFNVDLCLQGHSRPFKTGGCKAMDHSVSMRKNSVSLGENTIVVPLVMAAIT